ncbi:MAG: LysM peptidoglycan-binding domain-containing protein [Clostridia bacterium]|nr:LysM peptidoglycan-binding domain-containing protein [Clostridia bacterium]
MTIYVVKSGDTVWSVAGRFRVSEQSLININGLSQQKNLVVGQSLVIPVGETPYTVRQGDTIWSIASRFNVNPGSIALLNGVTYPYTVYPGSVIRIPKLDKNYGFMEVNAYIEPSTAENEASSVNETGSFLTYLSPFSYQVREDGSLTSINDTVIIRTGRQYRNAPLLVITNFREGNFDSDLAHTILSNNEIQQNLINNVLSTMRNKGYYGLNIDFERIPVADRELYNNFLTKVVDALHRQNYVVSTALAPKTSGAQTGAWYGAHDYPAHGRIVDFVILMTYEWGWSGGPPYAVAPIDLVRQVLDYAVSVIPRNKIFMGVPLYGYNWTLPYVQGGKWARRISPVEAVNLAAENNSSILYSIQTQSPHFNYTDENGVRHEVWFEDARSIQEKFRTASEYGLRGVSYWVLGEEFPQNWAVLDNMFNIVKVVS